MHWFRAFLSAPIANGGFDGLKIGRNLPRIRTPHGCGRNYTKVCVHSRKGRLRCYLCCTNGGKGNGFNKFAAGRMRAAPIRFGTIKKQRSAGNWPTISPQKRCNNAMQSGAGMSCARQHGERILRPVHWRCTKNATLYQ